MKKLDPKMRAEIYCKGDFVLDLAGKRFLDSQSYFLVESNICDVALSIFSKEKNEGNTFWFPVIRECVQQGLDIQDSEFWAALTFMAMFYLDFKTEEVPAFTDDAKEIATDFRMSLRQQDLNQAFKTKNLRRFFESFLSFAGFKHGTSEQPSETLAISLNAVDLGHACAAEMDSVEREAFLITVDTKPYFEQLIIKSAHAARSAHTSCELMISPLIRSCILKYKGFPKEFDFFASYYQEAETRSNLTFLTKTSVWVLDADAYSKAVTKIKPAVAAEIIDEHLEGMVEILDLLNEIKAAVPDDDAISLCEYYWSKHLGYAGFDEVNILAIDKILILVDLIVWHNFIKSQFHD